VPDTITGRKFMQQKKQKKKRKPSAPHGSINPVAKNCRKFNKAAVHIDRKKEAKKQGEYT
jgi:hypothetical protein